MELVDIGFQDSQSHEAADSSSAVQIQKLRQPARIDDILLPQPSSLQVIPS